MTTESPKSAAAHEPAFHPPPIHYPYGAPYPPPPFVAYPTPPEGVDGAATGPYVMAFHPPPPGMVYAYPAPPPGYAAPPPAPASSSSSNRPKRQQVKMACTNCASACKRCDDERPCERCMKYGLQETCIDGLRKERKKGIKRGPYKRKQKQGSDGASYGEYPAQPAAETGSGGEWSGSGPPAAPAALAATPPIAAYGPPEGYYPVFYPPHMFPPPAEGAEGAAANGHPPAVMPFYHPYPYLHYGPIIPHPPAQAPTSEAPSPKKHNEPPTPPTPPLTGGGSGGSDEDSGASPVVTSSKRRTRSKDSKTKPKRQRKDKANEDEHDSATS